LIHRSRSTNHAARLGVADHALDRGKARAQRPLHVVDPLVHLGIGDFTDAEMPQQ